ncbi:unnamed protein product [Cyclocybe aegerita]|uniref:FAD-binding PCMH-type domain-containing protein n=1 Tax=Cyclocybe aegerita TaxID=1973307 RepID=A0A8S0VR13_CYCAE|nr:unnamed protein product [Cyclocybe aegerita]
MPSARRPSRVGLSSTLRVYLNGVTVDPSKKLAYVGGGAIWEIVFREGVKHGLGAVGGAVNHTVVGGYTLGGGYGWLTSAYGLAADSLVQATIVTANGSVLTVNDTEHPDLYLAIRGGGGNFGVITEFVLQLHIQRPTVYSGTLVYPASATEDIVEATHKWQEIAGEKDSATEVATVDDEGNAVFIINPFYNGTESEGRERFKDLLAAGPVSDTTKEISFEELNTL